MGEEAIAIGSASALRFEDTIFSQYREAGTLMWRGFPLQRFADQCFGNGGDVGKGRQMPVHYGSVAHNFQTISSPLGTQILQASGAAYRIKLTNEGKPAEEKNIAICYFGDGAASEGDFHPAINFASTTEVPIVFFCRNNGYAISTPVTEQFRGDGIISRAAGYGIHGTRVDGNDLFAVHEATVEARKIAVENNTPVMIEAMSYRVGHHSTSDDSTRYRSVNEIRRWQTEDDPVDRFKKYMERQGWWNEDMEQQCRDEERLSVLTALETAERTSLPDLETLFEDVYCEKPPHLLEQESGMLAHVAKYPEHYKLDGGH
eukprot:CAMPEP_0113942550 /NCGR_PEP_ID=MMETSP1339-20121228/8248_1 /TAXON_ID=94617 /ORGANISM="Fibrocapsa japonica" /LENGTH=316 /DNA_ID=CAMNT_0000947069 /DNA_START=18 /DNA_END=968 /DNA_ORIENTATION=+ /assembly_acc=CAM_ASM_000762